MPSPFPPEIWQLITRHAITRPWPLQQFNRPQGDFDSVEGFAQASTVFEDIVQYLKDEYFAISLKDFMLAQVDDAAARRVRYLQISSASPGELSQCLSQPRQMFRQIAEFSMLTSISFPFPALPFRYLRMLEQLPCASCLESIDVRGRWEMEIETDFAYRYLDSGVRSLRFPNLLRLRLSKESWFQTDSVPKASVAVASSFFGACQKLELISIHTALHDDTWTEQLAAHAMSIEHLQPSEGYERDLRDCPLCFDGYDHSKTVREENSATRSLAIMFPKLAEVRFANLWARNIQDECGQRGTKITRDGNNIILTRDDGMNE